MHLSRNAESMTFLQGYLSRICHRAVFIYSLNRFVKNDSVLHAPLDNSGHSVQSSVHFDI